LIPSLDAIYREVLPDLYARQRFFVSGIHPDWVIAGTVFTSGFISRNSAYAAHRDTGNLSLPLGLDVLGLIGQGDVAGGFLIYPRYRLAINLQHRDVLLFDQHELHGNSTILAGDPNRERISIIMYVRRSLIHFGSAAKECRKAQQHA
jgi:hypothetical protein